MEIVYKKVEELKPYKKNSRVHSNEQIDLICRSIREYGFTNPVLIDEKNNIIAGHGRVESAKRLAMNEVPCIVLSHLTETQKKAYVIADNKMALNASWNDDLLKLEIEDLKELDFDLSLTGFNEKELDSLLGGEEIETVGEVPFTEILGEEHNYIVLYFDNEVDWLQAESLFDIKQVQCPSTRKDNMISPKMKRVGVGRVLKGKEAIEKLIKGNYESIN